MILMVVTPFILSTGIYNINNFLDNTIYQRIMMDYRKLDEAVVAMDLSVVAKGSFFGAGADDFQYSHCLCVRHVVGVNPRYIQ